MLSLQDGLCGGAQIETSQERLLLVAETTSWDSLSVLVTRPSGAHGCAQGHGAEAAACSHSTLPSVECPAPDPQEPRKQEAGGSLSPTAAKLFCLLS